MLKLLIRETVLGYVFWSIFQGLGPMIWFYPLNELEISGYEAFAVLLLSPVLLGLGIIYRLLDNRIGLGILRLGVVVGLGSFQAPDTLTRLIILAIGNACNMLVFTLTLYSKNKLQRSFTFWGIILGLFLFLTGRIWLVSFVPTWWSYQSNSIVVAIATLCTIDKIISGEDGGEASEDKNSLKPYWLFTAGGFGSLLYLTHWVFGDVSLVTRWSVSGFPDTGPSPNPWGGVILVCLAVGALLSQYTSLARSKLWWLLGCASFGVLYYQQTWTAFAGGAVLAIYTMSIWPEMIDRLTSAPPARTVTFAAIVWLIEIFFYVWTVAYNFVPGGVYTREHTDWLIAFVMFNIGLALFTSSRPEGEASNTGTIRLGNQTMPNTTAKCLLVLLVLGGLGGFVYRYDPQRGNNPPKESPKQFSAAIWTYHFGYDNVGWPSLERGAKLLNDTGADFITLLESDASKPFLGNNDLGMWLAERLNMHVDFGPSTRDHTWGNLILSKYPIVKSTHHLLPSPHGELAPAVTVTIDYSGSHVDFVVTHMGNDRDVLDRELQAKFLSNECKKSKNPVVFLGYVTSSPGSRDYRKLINGGNMKDIDDSDNDRWCEYIMYRGLTRLGYARISHGGLSDTEVQIAKFQIPEDPKKYKDNSRLTTDESKVPKKVHFNKKFGPLRHGHNWLQEHLFHMGTPKYFIP
ncbi:unnamed protein product [Owenia fusiformis]|uniref:PGAP2-interacting protein n=1 Tax=Owenia fusiformis TaxID=6347 RepID=A0A8S4NAW3_OWEFU|nr:unnamed protein product [Owenia fusiformis]